MKQVFLRKFCYTLLAFLVLVGGSVYIANAVFGEVEAASTTTQDVYASENAESVGDEVVVTGLILNEGMQDAATEEAEERPTYLDITEEEMNWYVKVNHIWNTVTIYTEYYPGSGEFDQPYKAFVVSVGTGNNTKLGIYKVGNNGKNDWRYEWQRMEGNSWTQYDVRFEGSRLFHSPVYSKKGAYNTMSTSMFNNLGQAASHGCIRMRTGDAYWMYTHLKEGTTVEIYSDPESPGPLGKPVIQRITNACPAPYRTWDPTDPNPSNPWLEATEEQLELWLEDAVYQDPVTVTTPEIKTDTLPLPEIKPVYLVLASDDGILHLPLQPSYEQIKANFACYHGDDTTPTNWNLYFEGPHDLETPGIYTVQAYAMDVTTGTQSSKITVVIQVE